MTQYTTGELAKLCDITVRTVQFYDSKDLLKPSELTDGGRRLYSEGDLEKLRVICFLKDLGFTLRDIAVLVNDPDSDSTLRFLLENQRQEYERRIEADHVALERIQALQESFAFFDSLTPKNIGVIANIMDSRKKLRNVRIRMLLVGLVMDVAWIAPLVYGIVTRTWWPFAIGLCVAIVLGVLISRYYIEHTAYVCPEDHTVFRPPLLESLFARHTISMRKLACPTCGNKLFCLEVYAPDSAPEREGKHLVWESAGE